MKICIICTRFDPKKLGGVERVILDLSRQYIKKGNSVTIICKREANESLEEDYEGIKIKRAKCMKVPLLKTVSASRELARLITKEEADIYNPHDWSSAGLFLFGKLKKLPTIITSHGFLGDYVNPPFFAKIAEGAVYKITKSPIKCVQKYSENTDYLETCNIDYIPNGVDSNYFKPSKKKKSGDYALFVASLDDRKNIARVCESFSKNKIKIKVVGDGPLREALQEKYNKYKNIEFLGRKNGIDLLELFQDCKFFILPSTAEGFGLVWIEAQSCGKPIIATKVGVGQELILDEDFGRLVEDPMNQKELDEAIVSLNKQIDAKGVKTNKIRKNVLSKYSWDVISDRYIEEFRGIIKK